MAFKLPKLELPRWLLPKKVDQAAFRKAIELKEAGEALTEALLILTVEAAQGDKDAIAHLREALLVLDKKEIQLLIEFALERATHLKI